MTYSAKFNLVRFLISLGMTLVALIPTGAFFAIKHLLSPTGFWQRLVVFGGGIYLFGGLQVVLLIMLVVILVILWGE